MPVKQTPQTVHCDVKLFKIGSWTILRLPEEVSKHLPSRGQLMVKGTLNGVKIETPLEPDGKFSHWFRVDDKLLTAIHASAGDTVTLEITPTRQWPEPDVPSDLQEAIAKSAKASDMWPRITPMARWEWIRWARATNNVETRKHRVEVAISKMEHGERRPCCWNRNLCTEPQVSKSGVLLGPDS